VTPPGSARRNIELKARDPDPERTRARCLALGAREAGTLCQRDTYFAVPRGRLKLREQEPGPSVLVQYERAEEAAARISNYVLVEIADSLALRQALSDALGVACVIEKERRLFLWEETVRIHLDRVKGLGAFIEIEAVAGAESNLQREREQAERLRSLLAIEPAQLVAAGYSDLLR
jgi:adenylate cyclase class IV